MVHRTTDAAAPGTSEANVTLAHRAVIVGYGPIGQTVARLLHDGGIEPVIIEMNLETTRRVRQKGHQVVYGDATRSEVLEAAGIRTAVALFPARHPMRRLRSFAVAVHTAIISIKRRL